MKLNHDFIPVVVGSKYCKDCELSDREHQTLGERNPHFTKLLEEIRELHDKKSRDYAESDNVYSNFEYAANVAGVSVDQVFGVLIGVKLARILNLLSGKTPLNESLLDSFRDLTTYCGIWTAYKMKQANA